MSRLWILKATQMLAFSQFPRSPKGHQNSNKFHENKSWVDMSRVREGFEVVAAVSCWWDVFVNMVIILESRETPFCRIPWITGEMTWVLAGASFSTTRAESILFSPPARDQPPLAHLQSLPHHRNLSIAREDGLCTTGKAPSAKGVQILWRWPFSALAICLEALLHQLRHRMFSHVHGTESYHSFGF